MTKKSYIIKNPTNGFNKPTKYPPNQKAECISAHISNYYNNNRHRIKNKSSIVGDVINTMISYQLVYNSFDEAKTATINHYVIESKV